MTNNRFNLSIAKLRKAQLIIRETISEANALSVEGEVVIELGSALMDLENAIQSMEEAENPILPLSHE